MSTETVEGKPNNLGESGRTRSYTFLWVYQPVFNHSIFTSAVSPAAERIRFILGEEDDSPAPPQLFTELDELLAVDGQEMEWKETARWGMADWLQRWPGEVECRANGWAMRPPSLALAAGGWWAWCWVKKWVILFLPSLYINVDAGYLLFMAGAYFINQGCTNLAFVDEEVNLNL